MSGCKPLSDLEVSQIVSNGFSGDMALRDTALFLLGIRTGFRISELLSLTVSDVLEPETMQFRTHVKVSKRNTKGKVASRVVALHPEAQAALRLWIESLGQAVRPDTPLFLSAKDTGRAIDASQAWRVLKAAFGRAGITGNTGTHSMRKTFAHNVYQALDRNLLSTQKALGHKFLDSTAHYLAFEDDETIDAAVLKPAIKRAVG